MVNKLDVFIAKTGLSSELLTIFIHLKLNGSSFTLYSKRFNHFF